MHSQLFAAMCCFRASCSVTTEYFTSSCVWHLCNEVHSVYLSCYKKISAKYRTGTTNQKLHKHWALTRVLVPVLVIIGPVCLHFVVDGNKISDILCLAAYH